MENNKNKKSVKFQGDMLKFCDFIQVFVFTRNHHLNKCFIAFHVSSYREEPFTLRWGEYFWWCGAWGGADSFPCLMIYRGGRISKLWTRESDICYAYRGSNIFLNLQFK